MAGQRRGTRCRAEPGTGASMSRRLLAATTRAPGGQARSRPAQGQAGGWGRRTLNGVDVVVGRRGDEAHAGGRVAGDRNVALQGGQGGQGGQRRATLTFTDSDQLKYGPALQMGLPGWRVRWPKEPAGVVARPSFPCRPEQTAPTHRHLVPRQLAALARLGALRNLNLQLVRVGEVVRRHAEAACAHDSSQERRSGRATHCGRFLRNRPSPAPCPAGSTSRPGTGAAVLRSLLRRRPHRRRSA